MLTLLSSSYHLPPATVERQGRKGAIILFSPLIFPWSLSQPGTENAVTRSAVLKILKQCNNESFAKAFTTAGFLSKRAAKNAYYTT